MHINCLNREKTHKEKKNTVMSENTSIYILDPFSLQFPCRLFILNSPFRNSYCFYPKYNRIVLIGVQMSGIYLLFQLVCLEEFLVVPFLFDAGLQSNIFAE